MGLFVARKRLARWFGDCELFVAVRAVGKASHDLGARSGVVILV
jgi:hypothetical protein